MKKLILKQLSRIEAFFSRQDKHSIHYLNSVQFLGALNDNIYKLVLIFFLIQLEGAENANYILSAAGAIFVIPFLLFSSMAGVLADRMSKSRLIIGIKAAEIVIILFAILAFALEWKWGGYSLLFLLATQSAMFGPSKYGIIPELVPKNKVSKANGLITSFTYLAIITGTFLATFLTEITNRNYILIGCFCLLVAFAGFASSFGVKYTPPKGSKKKIDPFFMRQIFHTLYEARREKHLLIAIAGSSYFLFIGSFTQLNIIPYAMQALSYTEVAGGWLFLATALGIACGAYLAGKASKSRIELGLSCVSGVIISIFFFTLASSVGHPVYAVTALFVIGLAGGGFIVPFDTFIQLIAPEHNRGHTIAATNFMSFVGVLISSFALFFFNQLLGLTAAKSFAVIGFITLLFTFYLILRLSDLFLSYTARKILSFFYKVKIKGIAQVNKASHPILLFEEATPLSAWSLFGAIPNLHLLVPQYKVRRFPFFQNFFYSIHRIETPNKFEALEKHSKPYQLDSGIPCIYLKKTAPTPEKPLLPIFRNKEVFIVRNKGSEIVIQAR